MLIEMMTGNQNFPKMLAKAYVFVVPSTAFPLEAELAIYAAAKPAMEAATGVRRHSGGARIMAGEGLGEAFGTFSQTTYDVPDGMILKLFAMKKPEHSNTQVVACQFIRTRRSAALRRLEVAMNPYARATVNAAYVEGRFDLLTLEEAEAEGVKVMPMVRRQFLPQAVSALMTTRMMAPETQTKVVVATKTITNSDGEEVQVRSPRSRRMLDV